MSAPARAASCSDLAARVRAVDGVPGECVGLRVFDTLGALDAGLRVAATRALPHVPGDGGLLADVRRVCAAVRCSEVDDFERLSCTTPGSLAVPVALLVGAAEGGRVAEGIVAGYEAMIAVGEAIDGPRVLRQGIWPSYLGAPVAAAATTAVVLGLDHDCTVHALAIAATRSVGAAGRIAGEPTSRWLTFGCAAADGVLAAYAARDGMLGDPDALGVLTGAGDVMARAAEPGIARVDAKPFCTARQALAAVEAARTARGELGDAPIAEIEVAVPAAYRAMVDQPEPGGRMTSIMSAQRQIALALTDDAGLYDVTRDDLTLPEGAAQLMAATHVVADDELTELYPEHFAARVRMRAADGGEAHCLVRDPLGARERPLGWADVREKHRRIGVRGERLAHTERLSRELGAGAGPAPARELLQLMTDPHQEAVT